ncbi:hypothetical protein BJ742DRAFT_769358 [Cladochytrium replicatum]|nr:hypothetical protein BJ742DRAFT_769358 [Cladochytrium replicatum]
MTDGVLMREAIIKPILSDYDAVLLEEAHEASLETDVVLGHLKRATQKRMKRTEEQELHAELDYGVDVTNYDTGRGLNAHAIYGNIAQSLIPPPRETAAVKGYNLYSRDAFENMDPETLGANTAWRPYGKIPNLAIPLTRTFASALGATVPAVQHPHNDDLDKRTSFPRCSSFDAFLQLSYTLYSVQWSPDASAKARCHLVSGGGTTCDALWKPVTSIPCRGRLWNNKNSSEEMRESCISEDCHEGGDGAGSLHIRALQAVKNVREQLEEVMVDLELLIDRSAIPARMNLAGLVEMRINGRKSEANDDRNRMRSSDATFSPAGDLERNQSPLQCAFPSSRTTTRESPFLFPLPERSRRTNDADAGGIARSG